MLRKRVIPIVLLDGFSVLKTIKFDVRRNLGSPITVARTYNTRNVDELVLLDIDATKQNRCIDKFTIAEVANECFMPLTVGGGISKIKDIRELLVRGADKVCINSHALKAPEFITEASEIFGSQCIVVSIDVVRQADDYFVFSNGKVLHNKDLISWIKEVEALGAGELLINSVAKDGGMTGGDSTLASLVVDNTSIPVIYVGGISSPQDALRLARTNVSGIGAASIFHFTNFTPSDCKLAMKSGGVPVRTGDS